MGNIKAAVVAVALVGGVVLFLARDQIFFLQHFEGDVIRVWRDEHHNVSTDGIDSTPMAELRTASGEVVEVELPEKAYTRVRAGMHVSKRVFSNRIVHAP